MEQKSLDFLLTKTGVIVPEHSDNVTNESLRSSVDEIIGQQWCNFSKTRHISMLLSNSTLSDKGKLGSSFKDLAAVSSFV